MVKIFSPSEGFWGERRVTEWRQNMIKKLMKTFVPIAACLVGLAGAPVWAQAPSAPQPLPARPLPTQISPGPPPPSRPEPPPGALTKFDLDFPGGTPRELVGAIQKALGR